MSRFLDPRLRNLEPYTPGEQPKLDRLIKLNTNENPYPPSPLVLQRVAEAAEELRLYPDPMNGALADAMAKTFGVGAENVFLANGSDEVLAFLFQALCPNGAAFADVTYGFYAVYAARYGVQARIVPLRADYTLAPEDYHGLNETCFIANPNAPTGLAVCRDALEGILQANPDSLLVVDEAYVDFGGESCVPLTKRYGNLVVTGTFSKSRNLAGARLGYAIASKALIEDLELVKFSYNPYNVNRLTAASGVAALEDTAYFEACRQKVVEAREYAASALRELDFSVLPSRTNFLFAAPPGMSGKAYFAALRARGILVRHFDTPRCTDHVRISIGTMEQMRELVQVSKELISGN